MPTSDEFRMAKGFARFYDGDDAEAGFSRYLNHLSTTAPDTGFYAECVRNMESRAQRGGLSEVSQSDHEFVAHCDYLKWLGSWGASACPVVRLESSWAACMAWTSIPRELHEFVVPPWSSFALELPSDLGFVFDWGDGGGPAALRDVRVARWGRADAKEPVGEEAVRGEVTQHVSRMGLWLVVFVHPENVHLRMTMPLQIGDLCGTKRFRWELDESVHRTLRTVFPLIGAVCMAFQSDGMVRRPSNKARRNARRGGLYPTTNEYCCGSPVKVDLRMKTRAFVERGREGFTGPMTVQTMVRGHWKHHAHGQGRRERKFIHIEPYWKGLQGAPIVVRPHVYTHPPENAKAPAE